MGLGFKPADSTDLTPIDNAYKQGVITQKIFAFWLNR